MVTSQVTTTAAAGLSSLSFWLAAVETVAVVAMTLLTTAVAVVAANSPC